VAPEGSRLAVGPQVHCRAVGRGHRVDTFTPVVTSPAPRAYDPVMLQTVQWTGDACRLLDQTKLPTETVYVDVTDERQMWEAIRRLVVRGAPAIGVSAAFGVYLGVRGCDPAGNASATGHSPAGKPATADAGGLMGFYTRLNEVCDYLATSRPTAVNLFWAIDRMRRAARDAGRDVPTHADDAHAVAAVRARLLATAKAMLAEDTDVCRRIGEHGLGLLEPLAGDDGVVRVLTHCNAGGLATVQYGTALAPVYVGVERGVKFHVYAEETRPLLQGSRITAFELQQNGVPTTVICDGMAATVMRQGRVKGVIVGTDRVAANGDVANKIGTLGVAVLARHFGIPFYVAAPTSSVDLTLATGDQIPIEERDPAEVTNGMGKQTAPDGIDVYNPAFDVTPAELVTALITERGVVRPPYAQTLRAAVGGAS
jgi:methylthioribose-1-phosphate isomerase